MLSSKIMKYINYFNSLLSSNESKFEYTKFLFLKFVLAIECLFSLDRTERPCLSLTSFIVLSRSRSFIRDDKS